MKKNNGITLIALVITIVVLIILATVAITLSLGDNEIFRKASKAKENTLVAQNEEALELAKTTNSIDEIVGTRAGTTNTANAKLLWTNSSPDVAFAAQDITLANNDCNVFEIYYKTHTSEKKLKCEKIIKNYDTVLTYAFSSGSGSNGTMSMYRTITYNSNTTLAIANDYKGWTGQGSTIDNDYIIPLYIIGYNVGLFN